MTDNSTNEGQYLHVDKLIHEPARLNLMAQLFVVESADFIFLMRQTGLTQGNLSAHLSKLESAGFLKIKKGFVGEDPTGDLRSACIIDRMTCFSSSVVEASIFSDLVKLSTRGGGGMWISYWLFLSLSPLSCTKTILG